MAIGSTRLSFAHSQPSTDSRREARRYPSGGAAPLYFWASCVLLCSLALSLSISGYSLWTDEAFSAWLASHTSFHSLLQSLYTGDSSDLQMGLYYVWLYGWSRLFGAGEFALRAANIPFILLFSASLVWISVRIFRSRVAWLAAGLLPFVWQYAAEARAYMAVLAFSMTALAALLGFIEADAPAETRKFPWIFLSAILFGAMFHMLLLLAVLPLLTIAALWGGTRPRAIWREWIVPLSVFALPLAALAAFFLWTFNRPVIAYDYPHTGLRPMLSVAWELAGMSGFGPNRKLSLDFRPYLLPIALGGAALLAGAICALCSWFLNRRNPLLTALGAGVGLSCVEAVALAVLTGKQPDARHLAALVPISLALFMGLASRSNRAAWLSIILIGGTWLVSDIRIATRPEYWKEDYRAGVAAVVAIHNRTGAQIAIVGDPAPAAYYGLDVRGAAPCIPFGQSCASALSKVRWTARNAAPAFDAEHWPRAAILSWLQTAAARGVPVVVLGQLDRGHRQSAWWPILAGHPSANTRIHGFDIVLLAPKPS